MAIHKAEHHCERAATATSLIYRRNASEEYERAWRPRSYKRFQKVDGDVTPKMQR